MKGACHAVHVALLEFTTVQADRAVAQIDLGVLDLDARFEKSAVLLPALV